MRVFLLSFIFLAFLIPPSHAAEAQFLPIQELKTQSGIKVWLVEDHSIPVLSVQVAFKGAGARNDSVEKQGLMRLLSNTLDEGAADLTSQQFQKTLADQSISLSFSSSKDDFTVNLYTLTERQDLAFDLLQKALTAPRFDGEPLARMLEANLTRIRSDISDPAWIAARIMNDVYFKGHPYALNSGGTLSSLAKITREDLLKASKDFLTRDRLIVAVTGNIKPDILLPLIDKTFKNLPAASQEAQTQSNNAATAIGIFHYAKDVPQSVILMQGPSLDRANPDYEAALLANTIFGGGGFGSRLTEEVREKRGLTYGVYSSLADMALSDTVTISVSTDAAKVKTVLDLITAEQKKFIDKGVTAQELKDAKSYLIGSMPLSLTSSSEISSLTLGQMLDKRPLNDLDARAAKINTVTLEDVNRVAKKLFNPDQFTAVIVGQTLKDLPNVQVISTLPNVE